MSIKQSFCALNSNTMSWQRITAVYILVRTHRPAGALPPTNCYSERPTAPLIRPDFACDVLVVGAEPSGLILALCLALSGVSLRIIDKEPAYRVDRRGAGITVHLIQSLSDFAGENI
ncbi:hypothetical protein B0H14DRAFT_2564954 [Mycena olivaceomarginata]|nr:hypothetical protein B0H14DRAFT_2564954 [Mycena olivaceomarginata]